MSRARPSTLEQLFERRRVLDGHPAIPYPDDASMLDAVRARRKGVETSGMLQRHVRGVVRDSTTMHVWFAEHLDAVLDRNLAMVLSPEANEGVSVAVLHLDQIWRVSAGAAFFESRSEGQEPWSVTTDALLSILYGYTDEQRVTYRRAMHQRACWEGRTVYTVLTRPQRARVIASGQRSFGPANQLVGLTLFKHGSRHAIKRRAASLCPAGRTIARVSLSREFDQTLFERWAPGVLAQTLDRTTARALNPAVQSTIELLDPRGWA